MKKKISIVGVFIFVSTLLVGLLTSPVVSSAEIKETKEVTDLLVEYTEDYRLFSEEEIVPGVEDRKSITSQVELWSLEPDADIEKIQKQLLEDKNVLHVEPDYEY